jgi:O-antigen/teichoic acid export membrane protein
LGFSVIKTINATATSYLMSVDRQPLILKVTAVFVVFTLSLDALLIWKFGLNGAIAAYGLSSVGMVIVMNMLAFRLLQQSPLWKAVFITLFAATAAGVSIVLLSYYLNDLMPDFMLMVLGSGLYVLIYIMLLCGLGAIRHNELSRLESSLLRIGFAGKWFLPYLRFCIARYQRG